MNLLRAAIIAVAAGLVVGWYAPAKADRAPIRGIGQYTIPSWFKSSFLDLREDVAEAAARGKRLFVYFGQDGCPYCAELFNNNFSQKHIVDYTRARFDCIDLNLWGDREVTDLAGETLPEKRFAAKLKVWFTPTILLLDEHGNQVLRINGYYPPHQFLAALQYAGEKQEREMSFKEYLASRGPPPAAGKLHAESFFAAPPYDLGKDYGKPVAIFFEQKDCAGCDRLHESTFRQPQTLEQLRRFHVIQLDRWSDVPLIAPDGQRTTARAFADTLNVAYVPSAVLFDQGREVIRIEAMLKGFHVQSVLDYAASGAYKRQPSLQRFIQERADDLRERGIVVDLWQ